jgi:type IV secretory pathway VirB3-like protein
MRPYSVKVHRSLLNRELIAGIPQVGLLGLIIISVFFLYVLRMIFMIIPIVVLYFIMRFLTAKDPWMIDIVLESIRQKEVYLP